jgi:signal transduction histidine kinase
MTVPNIRPDLLQQLYDFADQHNCSIDDALEQLLDGARQDEVTKTREVLALKENFASMVSHEFRTPLSVILTACELVAQYEAHLSRDDLLLRFASIHKQSKLMVQMLTDILLINQASAGMLTLKTKPIDTLDFCANLIDRVRISDPFNHRLEFQPLAQPRLIQADPRLLDHILFNLLTNAAKYSPANSVITLTCNCVDGMLIWTVRDEGIGVSADDQAHLYKPFFRANNVGDVEGAGLGLTIVQHCVAAHGGTIRFDSAINQGTTVTVRIPL